MIAEERAHHGLTELIPVDTMHERKHRMMELADAFVALPGGIGTMEEFFEAFTWLQLGLHSKPVGVLNAFGFYDLLLRFLDHVRDQEFLTASHLSMLAVSSDPGSLLDQLAAAQHAPTAKPVSRTPTAA
jgi:uncharacterized protein (TIGR00730 family)